MFERYTDQVLQMLSADRQRLEEARCASTYREVSAVVDDFPHVRISNDSRLAWRTKIELGGVDISRWVYRYEVGASLKDLNTIKLELFAGSLDIDEPVLDELDLGPVMVGLLRRHGWTPPSEATA
ncbi:MAG: hypothetical protein WA317_01450 [Mycobacterium sp.]|uniref:hypothetical protein n=1 Tax=Mycobacterium sp. TaxID=1785 RepID=UPI003CC5D667